MMKQVAALASFAFVLGCGGQMHATAQTDPQVSPATATPPPAPATTTPAPGTTETDGETDWVTGSFPFAADWDGRAEAAPWTGYLATSLIGAGRALLDAAPNDATLFCPNFAALSRRERAQFWITLISAVAKRESGFNPNTRYDEPGLEQDSIGLMQLSLSDAQIYGCAFTSEDDIKDPQKNLDCAVRIMARLIPRAGHIGGGGNRTGAAAYWSTLRDRPQNVASRNYVISRTSVSPGCALPQ